MECTTWPALDAAAGEAEPDVIQLEIVPLKRDAPPGRVCQGANPARPCCFTSLAKSRMESAVIVQPAGSRTLGRIDCGNFSAPPLACFPKGKRLAYGGVPGAVQATGFKRSLDEDRQIGLN